MKHYYIHYWLFYLIISIFPIISSAQISKNCNFSQLQYQYTDTTVNGITYRTYYVDGFTLTDNPGAPQLPCQLYSFSLPYNATNIVLQPNKNVAQFSQLQNCTIMPSVYPKAMCDSTPEQILPNSVIYNTNAYYPYGVAELVGEGYYMGENHIVNVAVYPMQFNPVTGMCKLNQNVSFNIIYNIGSDTTSNTIVSNNSLLRQKAWDEVKSFVENPNQVEGFAPNELATNVILAHHLPDSLLQLGDSIVGYDGGLLSSMCEYMIVTTRNLAPSFRRLAALKRQKGYSVGIKCIEDIVSSPLVQCGDRVIKNDGTYSCINDSAGKLRQYLRLAYSKNNTNYVLFGGRNVPFRYGYLNSDSIYPSYYYQQKDNFPTDWYFGDLTSNWNKDNDNYYGERKLFSYPNGYMDFNPELFVGRLMCDTELDVNCYTKKLLTYELYPGHGDFSYLKSGLYVDGSNFNATKTVSMAYYPIFSDSTIVHTIDSGTPTGSSIVNLINQTNFGLLSLHGHGAPTMVSINAFNVPTRKLVSIDSYSIGISDDGLNSLRNKNYPSIYYSWSCEQIPFDIFTEPYNEHTYLGLNMGQSFTLGMNYGGVAFLGYTRYGYNTSYAFEKKFAKRLVTGTTKIGQAETLSKLDSRHLFHTMGHNLMGEPEFEVWTDIPSLYSNISVSRSNNSITVSGISTDSTIVAICDNNGETMRKYSVNGSATFSNVSPNSTIMLYKHNYLPYIAPMYIQNTMIDNSQYVIAKEVYIGRDVDSNRTVGDVKISAGVCYEMEFTDGVNIPAGFEVEKGAEFTLTLSDY